MARVSVSQMLNALVDLGRQYLDRPAPGRDIDALVSRCRELVSAHGEASGTALASGIVGDYSALADDERFEVLRRLDQAFGADRKAISEACTAFAAAPDDDNAYVRLTTAIEAPRQELFRRLNMAPGGTGEIIKMRELLLSRQKDHPELKGFERDMRHLLASWFNRGFLQFERIDWRTPAVVLEKLIAYEAVHEIRGWDDLRRRLSEDRRCFAFFHPALPDEPLIFVEVALTNGLAGQVQALLETRSETASERAPDTAIFYSISNCQEGLAGISFGNFLIKQVADAVQTELPHIKRFATLSPIPGFRRWLDDALVSDTPGFLSEDDVELLKRSDWRNNEIARQPLRPVLLRLCAHYLVNVKVRGRPVDPVARFHLGNGASVERINWAGDLSRKGVEQSAAMMVNYLYDSDEIVSNHEAFVRDGVIVASQAVTRMAAGRD